MRGRGAAPAVGGATTEADVCWLDGMEETRVLLTRKEGGLEGREGAIEERGIHPSASVIVNIA